MPQPSVLFILFVENMNITADFFEPKKSEISVATQFSKVRFQPICPSTNENVFMDYYFFLSMAFVSIYKFTFNSLQLILWLFYNL
jgi:hypothetical protein